nr:RNA-directed DNA polymerase, eukaryota, reverse transcriptase zinc-binding domain protein [Tanacetum cinerariifolium]
FSWIAWDKVLSYRNHEGLGIGSLSSYKQAMLAKWWWRFRNENHALWRKVIFSIHGLASCLNDNSTIRSNSGVWYHIVRLRDDLFKININLPSIFKIKLGNGQTTSFWHDTYAGGLTFHILFPRLHKLDVNPNCYVTERCSLSNVLASVSHLIDIGSANPNPPGLLGLDEGSRELLLNWRSLPI